MNGRNILKKRTSRGDVLLFLYYDQAIPQSQIDGFRHIEKKSHYTFIYHPFYKLNKLLNSNEIEPAAVFMQVDLYPKEESIIEMISTIKRHWNNVPLVFLDWYAPTDLRYTQVLEQCDLYIKKNLLKDMNSYSSGFRDTNLVDYEGQYNESFMTDEIVGKVNSCFWKIIPGWSFITDKKLNDYFHKKHYRSSKRPINIHCRMAVPDRSESWYSHMRQRCYQAVKYLTFEGVFLDTSRIKWKKYMKEIKKSRLCFSPFGFGEVCWRDFESIASGSVLVKQDMSHMDVHPQIYIPFETYIPINWELTDLQEQTLAILCDGKKISYMTENAVNIWRNYMGWDIYKDWDDILKRINLKPENL